MLSSVGSGTALGLPNGNCRGENADAEANDGTAYNELRQSKRRGTQCLTDQCEYGSEEDTLAASEDIANLHTS